MPSLHLIATRPEEGLSVELELRLAHPNGRDLSRGRVPLASGYLAVIKEVERQLAGVVGGGRDGRVWFELHHVGEADSLERSV